MTEKPSPRQVVQLLRSLQHNAEARPLPNAPGSLDAGLERLRAWQSQRLAATYADLLADDQYCAACRFFLDDLYGAQDFSRRDQDAERLHAILNRLLPESMLRLLADALRLDHLTHSLDGARSTALDTLLPPGEPITPEAYAQGYRICNNYSQRRAQIELLIETLGQAAYGARGTVFTVGLRLLRAPAYNAGWQELHAFLERGVLACRPMKNISTFTETIHHRELTILDNIFASRPAPFSIL